MGPSAASWRPTPITGACTTRGRSRARSRPAPDRHLPSPVMQLSDRSLGWLRYLHRKTATPDDWSRTGHPHPHWDDRSDPPLASWHRFDLVDSSYAVGLMARATPAWREVYVRILD